MGSGACFILFSRKFDSFGIFALSMAGGAFVLGLILVCLITRRSANIIWRLAQTLIPMAPEDARRPETLGPARRVLKRWMMHSGKVMVMETITEEPEEDPTKQKRKRNTITDLDRVNKSNHLDNPDTPQEAKKTAAERWRRLWRTNKMCIDSRSRPETNP